MTIATSKQQGDTRTAFGFKRSCQWEDGLIESWGYGDCFQWMYLSKDGERFTDNKTYPGTIQAIAAAKRFLQTQAQEQPSPKPSKSNDSRLQGLRKLQAKWKKLSK